MLEFSEVTKRFGAVAAVTSALAPLVGAIPVAAMRDANYLVDRRDKKKSPEQAARWLAGRIGR